MRISAPLLTIAGMVAGIAASVVAYQSAASVGSSGTEPASIKTESPAPVSTTRWLPCEHGWKVVGKACIKVKEKVVVVHDLPAQAAAPARSVGVRSASAGGNGSHHTRADDAHEPADGAGEDQSGADTEGAIGHEDVGHDD